MVECRNAGDGEQRDGFRCEMMGDETGEEEAYDVCERCVLFNEKKKLCVKTIYDINIPALEPPTITGRSCPPIERANSYAALASSRSPGPFTCGRSR